MVRRTLALGADFELGATDASDALALAVCHLWPRASPAHHRRDRASRARGSIARNQEPQTMIAKNQQMIASINGLLALREAGRVIVETGGVGYEVFIPLSHLLPPCPRSASRSACRSGKSCAKTR